MYKVLLSCWLLSGCQLLGPSEKCDPGQNKVYETASINFQLLDARTSQNLLAVYGSYNPDIVQVDAESGQPVFRGPVGGDGSVLFSPLALEAGRLPYGTDLTRAYYLPLSATDQDTLALHFRLQKNACDFAEFERYRLSYNGREVATGQGLKIPSLVLYKK